MTAVTMEALHFSRIQGEAQASDLKRSLVLQTVLTSWAGTEKKRTSVQMPSRGEENYFPASAKAAFVASMMALEVTVAPDTVSTSVD